MFPDMIKVDSEFSITNGHACTMNHNSEELGPSMCKRIPNMIKILDVIYMQVWFNM